MESLKGRDFLSLADVSVDELYSLLELASQLKSKMLKLQRNKVLGLMFSKASTRTRVSFMVAMYQLGGQVIDLNPSVTQVSRGEPLVDTARVLDRYLDIIAIRTFEQKDLETFADHAEIPVINALTDREHPCQVLADLMTVQECFGQLSGLTLSYFGDGANNMAHSLMLGCAMVGMNIRIATPADHQPHRDIVDQAIEIAQNKTEVTVTDDPTAAAKDAHVIYTDVWASMGQEQEARTRIPLFQPYQVNEQLMTKAADNAIVLHCLPAHRDEEITDAVMEGKQSKVWDQAENRMHAQKALLAVLLG
ncbi:MAG: ornithine carbamoyltransferase [Cyanobacteria bacterium J06592_8]